MNIFDYILHSNSFENFYNNIVNLNNNLKGEIFEQFAQLYIEIHHPELGKYYRFNDISSVKKIFLNIPPRDKGIDAIIENENNNNFCSVQVKFRQESTLNFTELSTYLALTELSKNFKRGIIFTTSKDVCNEAKNNKYLLITYSTLEQQCNSEFWDKCRNRILYTMHLEKELSEQERKIKHPFKFQKEILDKTINYFNTHDKGKLISACGTGKTLLAFWTIEGMNLKKIIIFVPTLELLSQTYYKMKDEYMSKDNNPYISKDNNPYMSKDNNPYVSKNKNPYFLLIASDNDDPYGDDFFLTTDKKEINNILFDHNNQIIVICTYQSYECISDTEFKFDMVIYDEAHHTCGIKDKAFSQTVQFPNTRYKLFMTATEKYYIGKDINKVVSMDDTNIYGKTIVNYSLKQGIEDQQLSDYKIIGMYCNSENITKIIENNKYIDINNKNIESQTLITAHMIITCMEKYNYHHIILYSNKTKTATGILDAINIILSNNDKNKKIFRKTMFGEDKRKDRRDIIREFEKSELGILSTVRVISEGFDSEICDAICFVDQKNSAIDIIQCIGRCLRKIRHCPKCLNILETCKCLSSEEEKKYKNKVGHVLIPMIINYDENILDSNKKTYTQLRNILKTINNNDESVKEKFFIVDCEKISCSSKLANDYVKFKCGLDLDLDEFKESLIMKIFDKTGSEDNEIKRHIRNENRRRWRNNNELIVTKEDCEKFVGHDNFLKIKKDENWIEFCLDKKIYEQIKLKYFDNNKLIEECKKLNIKDLEQYKKSISLNSKFPSFNYINAGFYGIYFNLSIELDKNNNDAW